MRRISRVVGHRLQLAVALGIACGGQAGASTIVAPDSASASETFTSIMNFDFSIENTINQHGLSVGYTSGVTDFESYLANHITTAHDNEWFSKDNINRHIPGLTVTYGFSELTSINGFILWNEESAGIGTAEMQWSADGTNYTSLGPINPTPSPIPPPNTVSTYLAQVFPFATTAMLSFRLLISDCPRHPNPNGQYRCGIGEVAFRAPPPPDPGQGPTAPTVPLPAALPLFGSALGLFVWMGRRRKSYN